MELLNKLIKLIKSEFTGTGINYVLYAGNPRQDDKAYKIHEYKTLKEALTAMGEQDGHYKISQLFIREELK